MTIRNGVSVGNVAPAGGGTLNVANALLIDTIERISALGVFRPASTAHPSGATDAEMSGTPEGVTTAGLGSTRTDTTTGFKYRKSTPTGNTGWQREILESDMIAAAADFIAAAEFPPYATGSITPTLTCETPGTLSITSTDTCTWTRYGDTVKLRINFNITNVSKGTASGALRIGFADLPFIPVGDMAHGTILRKTKELNIADFGGASALDTELSVGAGDMFATVTYSTPAYQLQTLQIAGLEDYSGAAFNLSFNLEIFL
jgi:hypothetical protein